MNIHQIVARYLLASGLIAIALALAYFSYSIVYAVDHIPTIIADIDRTSERVDRVLDEVDKVSELIPPIVAQADLLQQKIPLILAEAEAARRLVPDVLKELEQIRTQMPSILEEVQEVRKDLPAVLKEVESYRLLLPDVLQEVKAVRETIPPTLDRTEKLIEQAKAAGQKASEGAVQGVLTGIFKAPFSWMKSIGQTLFPKLSLSDSDLNNIKEATELALQADVGLTQRWDNPTTKVSGKVTVISESTVKGQRCRRLGLVISTQSKQIGNRQITMCLQKDGDWELAE